MVTLTKKPPDSAAGLETPQDVFAETDQTPDAELAETSEHHALGELFQGRNQMRRQNRQHRGAVMSPHCVTIHVEAS